MTAEFTVTEKHVGKQQRDGRPAEHFHDSVGIGYYRIDLHPSTNGRHYINVSSLPFQVPLRSLLPRDVSNVIAAGKAMGTTHITNGCYRVHPVEWNVGEVAGYAAAWCVERRIAPHDLLTDRWLQDFQSFLDARGVEREWPQSVTNEVLQEVEPYLHT
jgi:hypothetical protein